MFRSVCLALVLSGLLASSAAAQGGFSLSKLNPFRNQEPARVTTGFGDEPAAKPKTSLPKLTLPKLSMPKLSMPTLTLPKVADSRPRAAKPSPLTRLNDGTKSLFTKSKDLVTSPWKKTQDSMRTATYRKPEKKKSFFSLFSKEPEPRPVESVGDFIQRPRVN